MKNAVIKTLWQYKQLWLKNEKYLRDHRYEGTYMAYNM